MAAARAVELRAEARLAAELRPAVASRRAAEWPAVAQAARRRAEEP